MILWTKNEMAENLEKLSDVNKNILPEFQKFLIERKLAPKKNVPFLTYWSILIGSGLVSCIIS